MMKNLGGWRRLWIVASSILLVPASFVVLIAGEASQPYQVVGITLATWAVVCALIYVLGAAAGWIYRGFQPREVTKADE